jgi:hypothetical protein
MRWTGQRSPLAHGVEPNRDLGEFVGAAVGRQGKPPGEKQQAPQRGPAEQEPATGKNFEEAFSTRQRSGSCQGSVAVRNCTAAASKDCDLKGPAAQRSYFWTLAPATGGLKLRLNFGWEITLRVIEMPSDRCLRTGRTFFKHGGYAHGLSPNGEGHCKKRSCESQQAAGWSKITEY